MIIIPIRKPWNKLINKSLLTLRWLWWRRTKTVTTAKWFLVHPYPWVKNNPIHLVVQEKAFPRWFTKTRTKKTEESHPKKRNPFTAKILLAFYTVISTVCTKYTSRVMKPKPDTTTYDKLINRFHEDNELYDGKLNQLKLSVFATSSNENYTYPQAMQQTDKHKFIDAMVVEVAQLFLWWLLLRNWVIYSLFTSTNQIYIARYLKIINHTLPLPNLQSSLPEQSI